MATIREKGYITIYNESAATIQYQTRNVPGGWPNDKYQEADYSHLKPTEWSSWTNLAAGKSASLSVVTPYKDKDGNYNVNYWFDKDLEVRIRPAENNSVLKFFKTSYAHNSKPSKTDAGDLHLRYFTDDAESWPTISVTCTCGYSATGNYYDEYAAIWVSENVPVDQLVMTVTADNTSFIKCPIGSKDESTTSSPYKFYFNNKGELEFWLQANNATDTMADVCYINDLQFGKLPSGRYGRYFSIPYTVEPPVSSWPFVEDSYLNTDYTIKYSPHFKVQNYNHVKSFFLKLPPNKSMAYSWDARKNSNLACTFTIPVGESNTLLYPYAYKNLADKQLKLLGKNALGESASSIAVDFASKGYNLTWTYLDLIDKNCSFGTAYISINGGNWEKITPMTTSSCPTVTKTGVKTFQLKLTGLHDPDDAMANGECYANGLELITPYAYKEAGVERKYNVNQMLIGFWENSYVADNNYVESYSFFDTNGHREGPQLSAYPELISPVITLYGDATLGDMAEWICVAEGTKVTLTDGTTKLIEDINYNDDILVWDFYEGKLSTAKPKFIKVEETAAYYNLLKFSNGTELKLIGPGKDIGYHRIYNDESKSFTHTGVADTPDGTTTFCEDGTRPTVVSQTVIYEPIKYYNIITDKHYNLFANGILTSCRLSNKYDIKDMKYVGEAKFDEQFETDYFAKIEHLRVLEEDK